MDLFQNWPKVLASPLPNFRSRLAHRGATRRPRPPGHGVRCADSKISCAPFERRAIYAARREGLGVCVVYRAFLSSARASRPVTRNGNFALRGARGRAGRRVRRARSSLNARAARALVVSGFWGVGGGKRDESGGDDGAMSRAIPRAREKTPGTRRRRGRGAARGRGWRVRPRRGAAARAARAGISPFLYTLHVIKF